jgi:hypothetical protein
MSDLKNNIYNILINNYKNDIVNFDDINADSTEIRYIDNLIFIQNTINKPLYAMGYDNKILLEFKNPNFINYTDLIHNSYNSSFINKFEITAFIDEDNIIYDPANIDYNIFTFNKNTSEYFILTAKLYKNHNKISQFNTFNINKYIFNDITSIASYEKFNVDLDITNKYTISDQTNIDATIDIDNNLSFDTSSIDATIFKIKLDLENINIEPDNEISVDIYVDNNYINSNKRLSDIFYGFKGHDYINIGLNDKIVFHYDIRNHAFNINEQLFDDDN